MLTILAPWSVGAHHRLSHTRGSTVVFKHYVNDNYYTIITRMLRDAPFASVAQQQSCPLGDPLSARLRALVGEGVALY